jgi:ABC-type uncharacterized transport system ATPase subunit
MPRWAFPASTTLAAPVNVGGNASVGTAVSAVREEGPVAPGTMTVPFVMGTVGVLLGAIGAGTTLLVELVIGKVGGGTTATFLPQVLVLKVANSRSGVSSVTQAG